MWNTGFFVCKLKKLDNNKRTDLKKDSEDEEEEEEEEQQQDQKAGAKQAVEEEPKIKVLSRGVQHHARISIMARHTNKGL